MDAIENIIRDFNERLEQVVSQPEIVKRPTSRREDRSDGYFGPVDQFKRKVIDIA